MRVNLQAIVRGVRDERSRSCLASRLALSAFGTDLMWIVNGKLALHRNCLLYTSDAADE